MCSYTKVLEEFVPLASTIGLLFVWIFFFSNGLYATVPFGKSLYIHVQEFLRRMYQDAQ